MKMRRLPLLSPTSEGPHLYSVLTQRPHIYFCPGPLDFPLVCRRKDRNLATLGSKDMLTDGS